MYQIWAKSANIYSGKIQVIFGQCSGEIGQIPELGDTCSCLKCSACHNILSHVHGCNLKDFMITDP